MPTQIVKTSSARDLIDLYKNESSQNTHKSNQSIRQSKAGNKDILMRHEARPYIEEEHILPVASDPVTDYMSTDELERRVNHLRQEMIAAAKRTDFIEAAKFRDEMLTTQALLDSKLNSDESK